jgi:hypothetical protein
MCHSTQVVTFIPSCIGESNVLEHASPDHDGGCDLEDQQGFMHLWTKSIDRHEVIDRFGSPSTNINVLSKISCV